MAVETVRVYVYDEATPANLVDGVLIRVYDEAGAVFITQDVTGNVITGAIEVGLPGAAAPTPTKYTIRMSKQGVAFDGDLGDKSKSPQKISIYSPPSGSPTGTNNFEVYGSTHSLPVASNPFMCRCSCYLEKIDGTPMSNAIVFVNSEYNPTFVDAPPDDHLNLHNDAQFKVDSSGFIQIDLAREGIYWITVQGLVDVPRKIYIPDQAGFSLAKLMFPVVAQVVYAPTSVSLAVGETVEVVPTVTFSDTRVATGAAPDDVTYTAADDTVVTVAALTDKLEIRGLKSGSTTLSAARADDTIVILPTPAVAQTPLAITVS